jgi:hypothetical protein
MIYRGEQDLQDAVADGLLSARDADAVRTFAQFLRETPGSTGPARRTAAWRERWLGYVCGLAEGPTTAEEFSELLPRLREMA